jgi:pyruvate formate lyase activating enzyme
MSALAKELPVAGLTPFTTIDYPGHLSAVIFSQGCPLRCPYCHNKQLLAFDRSSKLMPWRQVMEFFVTRQGWLEAAVFSGGEPTAHATLAEAMSEIKKLGFLVGLHSSGVYPENFAAVLPLVDWVGLDIKAPFGEKYDLLTRMKNSAAKVRQSLDSLLASGKSYQLRLTFDPKFHHTNDVTEINGLLNQLGADSVVIQTLREPVMNNL